MRVPKLRSIGRSSSRVPRIEPDVLADLVVAAAHARSGRSPGRRGRGTPARGRRRRQLMPASRRGLGVGDVADVHRDAADRGAARVAVDRVGDRARRPARPSSSLPWPCSSRSPGRSSACSCRGPSVERAGRELGERRAARARGSGSDGTGSGDRRRRDRRERRRARQVGQRPAARAAPARGSAATARAAGSTAPGSPAAAAGSAGRAASGSDGSASSGIGSDGTGSGIDGAGIDGSGGREHRLTAAPSPRARRPAGPASAAGSAARSGRPRSRGCARCTSP